MKLKCEYCGKEFESKRFQKFCSVDCAGKHKAKKIKCKCANCGKTILRTPKEIDRSKNHNAFCSQSCAASFNNSHFRLADKNPNYLGGFSRSRLYAKLAMRTYKHKCAICGLEEECCLQVHHIDYNRHNNDVDNLIIVCANCHCRIHRGGLIVDDDIKKKREFINDI